MIRSPFWFALIAILVAAYAGSAGERYNRASVDQAGSLRLTTNTGRDIIIDKEAEQTEFDQVAISPDGRSVGWLALYPNESTSYPIPLKLMIYSGGRLRAYDGNGLPVWRWQFTSDGKQVVFEQEAVHGGLGIHYELREVSSGKLVSEFSPSVDQNGQPEANQKTPDWVSSLDPPDR